MTNQEIFDKVWQHFVVNHNPFSRDEDCCLYRGPNGAACSVGIFIPDRLYDPELEVCDVYTLLSDTENDELRCLLEPNVDFFAKLQDIHDSCENTDEGYNKFVKGMKKLAKSKNLKIPCPFNYEPFSNL